MTRFDLFTDNYEFRFGRTKDSISAMSADDIMNAYQAESANDPHLVASYDTEEEARAALAEMSGSTRPQASNVFWLLCGSVAWIEENEYDADGEFVQNLSWVDWVAEPYQPDEEGDE